MQSFLFMLQDLLIPGIFLYLILLYIIIPNIESYYTLGLINAFCGLAYGYNNAIVSGLKVQIIKFTYLPNERDEDLLSVYYV